jgi:NADH-quinone oxidoreductase subunit N
MHTPTVTDWTAISPALVLAVWAMALLLIGLVVPRRMRSQSVAALALLGLAVAFGAVVGRWDEPVTGFGGAVVLDNLACFLTGVFILAGALTILISYHYLSDRQIDRYEYYALLLFSISGMALMAGANDFIILFIALELLSIPLYILAGFARPDEKSEESALKYFLLGAFASAFLIYGIALMYGGTGTTMLTGVVEGAVGGDLSLTLAGAGLVLVGLAFKVAAVPFHMWTPDVYEGAPTPVAGFMSVGAKAAGFAALVRIFLVTLPSLSDDWAPAIATLAALTIILGNVVAISQKNIKRMLAYSSIAHAGYILMGLAASNQRGMAGVLFYLLAYAFTNLGAFTVLAAMAGPEGEDLSFSPYSGLSKRKPWMAAAMALFMLSLTGIPPTGGFVAKYFLFWATVEADLVWLAALGVLTSVVSAFFYLRVVVAMYFDAPEQKVMGRRYAAVTAALVAASAGTLVLGLWPQPLLDLAQSSVWPILSHSVGF